MNIQMKDAEEMRKAWGNKPCDHPSFSKEYFNGMNTGDYICNQCGESFSPESKKMIEENRRNDKK